VQGGHSAVGHRPEQWELKLVDVEVQNIEVAGVLAYTVEHQHIIGNWIFNSGIKPQGFWDAGHKGTGRNGITAGEKSDVVPECNQFFS
jgi:hypothetical protein